MQFKCQYSIPLENNSHLVVILTCMNLQLVEDTSYFGTEYDIE